MLAFVVSIWTGIRPSPAFETAMRSILTRGAGCRTGHTIDHGSDDRGLAPDVLEITPARLGAGAGTGRARGAGGERGGGGLEARLEGRPGRPTAEPPYGRRSGGGGRHMHLSLDVLRTADGRLEGTVITESGREQPFSGTLDLLRILEDLHADRSDERRPPWGPE